MSVSANGITVNGTKVEENDLPILLLAAVEKRGKELTVDLVGAPGADAAVVRVLTQLSWAGIERIRFIKKGK